MKNMSFALTTKQFIDGSKDVTRRIGWAFLKPGDHFMAVEKCQGLKKGEHVKKLGECEVVSNDAVFLDSITYSLYHVIPECFGKDPKDWPRRCQVKETEREGFPDLTPEQFVEMFCREMHCTPETIVNRIEFVRVK